jgi:hypothetical protein
MRILESAPLTIGETKAILIKVPDSLLGDFIEAGKVMHRAETEFKREAILLGIGKGEMHGNPVLRRKLRQRQFAPEKAEWSQWNMAE